jgi:hypothetical protein
MQITWRRSRGTRRKEWPTKEGKRAGGGHYRGKGKPRRGEPTGRDDWLGLVTREGGEDQ